MQYLCLGYYDPAAFDAMTPDEIEALGKRCRPHDEALRATGKLVAVASLEHGSSRVVRLRGGRTSVTDGPFTEAKEQVGSFFIVEADDLDEAVALASKHPAAKLGEELGWGVEVRPIGMCLAG